MVLPVLALAGPASIRIDKGQDPLSILAEARLATGRTHEAVEVAQQCLQENPDSLSCLSVLARCKASIGRCDVALPMLARLRGTPQWTERTAMQEGVCMLRQGDRAAAIIIFDEAVSLRPANASARFQRSMTAVRSYDYSTVDEDMIAISESRKGRWMSELLELWRAWAQNDPLLDGLLAEAAATYDDRLDPGAFVQAKLVDCLRWLDVDDPAQAAESAKVGLRLTKGQPRLAACQGEALRRLGDPQGAWYLADRPWYRGTDSVLLESLAVRALVDMGRLPEAGAILDQLSDADESAVVAAWYYARGSGDAAEQLRLESIWAENDRPASRSLQSYIPIWEGP